MVILNRNWNNNYGRSRLVGKIKESYSGNIEICKATSVSENFLGKRLFDIFIASFGIITFFCVFVLFFPIYMLGENKGHPLYKQKRIGKDGKFFYIYKFRSMIKHADEKLKNNPELYQKYIDNNYKLEPSEDPRITNFGKFIRRTSLDEIPQFINVLRGEMSIVGPRPIVEEELKEYGELKETFLQMKPGITGVWQVNGRSNVGYPERCELELSYLSKRGLIFDSWVVLVTIYYVFQKRGAF